MCHRFFSIRDIGERVIVSKPKTVAIILGGGEGKRLQPLTRDRAKPAVPIAGKYRLVDIPISNCINSGIRRMYLLTQFNSVSLHQHIHAAYRFDHFSRGYIRLLAAQQTPGGQSAWCLSLRVRFIRSAHQHDGVQQRGW